MAIYSNPTDSPTFNSFVFDVTTQSPQLIGTTLSASNNSVVLDTIGVSFSGKTVAGILFNQEAANGNLVSLSAKSGTGNVIFRVAPNYHGETMALYFTDRSTTLFVCSTAILTQVVTSPNGFVARGPEEIRKRLLGYI